MGRGGDTKRRIRCALGACFSAALLVVPGSAGAATINVSNTGDENEIAVDNGICTLREAIAAVNTNATVDSCVHSGDVEPDTINLALGSYTLTLSGTNENSNANGDLDIDLTGGSLTIDGPDAGGVATINAGAVAERLLHSTADSNNTLALRDLVVTGGDSTSNGAGGGVITSNNNNLTIDHSAITNNTARSLGGGVFFSGGPDAELRVSNSIIRDNQVNGAGTAQGGGIRAAGSVIVSRSVIDNNTLTSTSTTATPVAAGGGIEVESINSDIETVIRNSSVINNDVVSTSTPTGAHAQGGGVSSKAIVEITNSTFSGNTATSVAEARGGGLAIEGNVGTHSIFHTTFDANDASGDSLTVGEALAATGDASIAAGGNVFTGPNSVETCERYSPNAPFTLTTDAGGNLDDGTSCDLDSAADQNQDPNLLPLAPAGAFSATTDTAGPPGAPEQLPVQPLPPGSPAVDHVSFPADCVDADEVPSAVTSDQRGFPRPFPVGGDCDSGAYELQDLDGDGVLDTADNCPTQAGPASNGGCPVVATPPAPQPVTPQPVLPTIDTFDLNAAIKKCKKKYQKGSNKRKRCIKKAGKKDKTLS